MTARRVWCAILSAVVVVAGCENHVPIPPAPGAPTPSPTPPAPAPSPSGLANWRASATVELVTGPGRACGWGTSTGETRNGVEWRITIDGNAILLEEDMHNWPTDHIPFSGTLRERRFTATYSSGDDYLRWVCQFKGATLSGTFSQDLLSFEALEELTWGPPGDETKVQRRWIGFRL